MRRIARSDLARLGSRLRRVRPPAVLPAQLARSRALRVTASGEVAASFMYKLNESKRMKVLLNHEGHRQRIWVHNSKRAGCSFAESLGVSVPAVVMESAKIEQVDWEALPERFVIKPDHGAANRGIFLLQRTGERYLDLMDGETKTAAEIIARYRELASGQTVSLRLSVEELLVPRQELLAQIDIPDDFKVYCFYDRPAVIMQRRMFASTDRSTWRFKFWSAQWHDLGPVKFADRYDPELPAPQAATALVDAATRIGSELAVPFVRVDLYDTDRGVVFGELSPHPGPPEVWSPDFDEKLGGQWEIAEARLLAEGRAINEPRPLG